jgi:hypothetical protein
MLEPQADKDGYLLLETYPYEPTARREVDYKRKESMQKIRRLVKVEA